MINNKQKSQLRFNSLLIVTYGRSGSTLLQGVMNSIDGVLVRGENENMCFHLFKAYQSIIKAKKQTGLLPQNPFFGVEHLDVQYYIDQIKETMKHLLLGDQTEDSSLSCYGFKEIGYGSNLDDLPAFLDFLRMIFPDPVFIFNTRNREDVVNSWINLGWKGSKEKAKAMAALEDTESAFRAYCLKHKNDCIEITYENLISKSKELAELFDFIGASYDEERIDSVLKLRHSYRPNQKHVAKMPLKPR